MKIVVARYNEDIHWILPIINICIVYNKGADDLHYIPQDKIIKCDNMGREGETYIKYILDNYDNLEDHTFFIQGKIYDHIRSDSIKMSHRFFFHLIKSHKPYNFKYISTWNVPVKKEEFFDYCSGLPAFPFPEVEPIPSINIINCIKKYPSNENINNLLEKLQSNKEVIIQKHELTALLDTYHMGEEPLRSELFKLYSHENLFSKIYHANKEYTYGSGALFVCSKQHIQKVSKDYWKKIHSTLVLHNCPSSGYGLEKMWNYLLNN